VTTSNSQSDEPGSESDSQDESDPLKLATLRYEQAAALVRGQRDSLNELRSRTGLLISAATISTSFLGSVGAKGRHGFPLEFLWPLVPFGLSILLSLAILLPAARWRFELRSKVFQAYAGFPIADALSGLAGAQEDDSSWNDNRLNALYVLFTVAAVAMLWSIIAWIVVIE
jgi:hypothetical protein